MAELETKKLFVRNIDWSLRNHDLEQFFSQYGEVASAVVIMDKMTGRSKGFGFVEFVNEEDAQKAVDQANGIELNGRALSVMFSEVRERPQRDGM